MLSGYCPEPLGDVHVESDEGVEHDQESHYAEEVEKQVAHKAVRLAATLPLIDASSGGICSAYIAAEHNRTGQDQRRSTPLVHMISTIWQTLPPMTG